MYCIIKHAGPEDEEKVFYINLDCALKFIMNYIQHETQIEGEFDLCDSNFELQYLGDYEQQERGNTILKEFQTYIVVLVERNNDGTFTKLTPVLPNNNPKKTEIENKLKRYINPGKRFSYELKKTRSSRASGKSVDFSQKKRK